MSGCDTCRWFDVDEAPTFDCAGWCYRYPVIVKRARDDVKRGCGDYQMTDDERERRAQEAMNGLSPELQRIARRAWRNVHGT